MVTTAPLRVNFQNEMECPSAGRPEHDDIGVGCHGGRVAAEAARLALRPPERAGVDVARSRRPVRSRWASSASGYR